MYGFVINLAVNSTLIGLNGSEQNLKWIEVGFYNFGEASLITMFKLYSDK